MRMDYLGPHDHAWLRVLIDEFERFEGRRQRELDRRLKEPLPCPAPSRKFRAATVVLNRLWKSEPPTKLRAARARAEVFALAARTPGDRDEVLALAARRLDTTPDVLEDALLSDLPAERVVQRPAAPPEPLELGLRVNLALAQSVVRRSTSIQLSVHENARPIVRHAKLRGLICTVRGGGANAGEAQLSISGPFALFRHTLVYGRALAELVPLLVRCPHFSLSARAILAGEQATFELTSGDPLFPATETRRFDSRLEERFARELARIAPDWDVIREPEAVPAGGKLIFPDFLLRHRLDPTRVWLVEIVGFWTPEYLARKLAGLREARIRNLILCIDEERQCSEADLPTNTPVVRFRRRINVARFMEVLEALDGHG